MELDHIEAMRMGVSYSDTIQVRNFRLSVRPLSMAETLHVKNAVKTKLQNLTDVEQDALTESCVLAQETLKIASTSAPGKNDAKITDLIMQEMTPEELQFLFKQYVKVVDSKNPALEQLTKEEVLALVDALKKTPQEELASALTQLSLSHLMGLCHALISDPSLADK